MKNKECLGCIYCGIIHESNMVYCDFIGKTGMARSLLCPPGKRTDMKRLTYFDGGKWRLKIGDTEYSGEAVDRLAAYEDTRLEPEDFKRTFTEDALLKLTGQLLGVTPDRLRELAQADREGRCVVLPLDDYTWTIRGDIVRGIIKANCRAAKKEAEAALRREKLMANKPVIGYQVCPYCGGKVRVIWDGNRKETCMYCKKRFQLKRQKLKNTMRVNCPPEGEVGMVKYIGNGGDQNGATDI